MIEALQSPDVKARLEQEGAGIIGNTPIRRQRSSAPTSTRWTEVIRKTGIKAE